MTTREPDFVPGQDAANAAALYLRLHRLIATGVLVPLGAIRIDVARLRYVLRVCRENGIRPQPDVVEQALTKLLREGS